MAVYNVTNPDSALTAVEFTPVAEGNFSFFAAKSPEQKDVVKKWLVSELKQTIIAETIVKDKPVFVTRGDKTKDEVIGLLNAHGDTLALQLTQKPTDTWKVVTMLAVPGQGMQLASSMMRPNRKVDWGLFAFASSNLLGHAISWMYGSQKSDDTNRLHFVKQEVNRNLAPHLPPGQTLPEVNDDRSSLRDEPLQPSSRSVRVNAFLRENSVKVGELCLRYFGAFALAFPTNNWGAALRKLKSGAFKEAYLAGRNSATAIHYTGMGSLTGKTIAMFAKVPDPYDDSTPHSALDTFREKYAFRLGGWIEAAAFSAMTWDALKNPENKIVYRGKEYQNYLSATGAGLFTTRYAVRHWAKYGEKEMDMNEMYAHVTDALAKMPADKLAQLTADTAADITNHFKDKHLNYSDVYSRLMDDLYRDHHIALNNLGTAHEERLAKINRAQSRYSMVPARNLMDRTSAPADSYTDLSQRAVTNAPMGIGA